MYQQREGNRNGLQAHHPRQSTGLYSRLLVAKDAKAKKITLICSPSLGDLKEEYRFLAPKLAAEGYTVIVMDLRGLGESDTGFPSHKPHDTGADIVAMIDDQQLENVVLISDSMSCASSIWAAAERPQAIKGLTLMGPFIRDTIPLGLPTLLSWCLNPLFGPSFWTSYYRSLYTMKPSTVPDLEGYITTLKANLSAPGRIRAVRHSVYGSKATCERRIPEVVAKQIPVLTLMGSKDPDFPKPEEEAKLVASRLGGSYKMIQDAGHYPHVEAPDEVAKHILEFLATLA